MESWSGIRAVATRAAYKKYRNLGIAAAAILIAFVGHWELTIPAEFKVLARNESTVRTETAAPIRRLAPGLKG